MADQKTQSHYLSHPGPTYGWRPAQHCWVASGLCDTHQTQPSLRPLTFPLICGSRQSNAIINKDHKQVTAFIPLKFRVQKRSFCGCSGSCLVDLFHILSPQGNKTVACWWHSIDTTECQLVVYTLGLLQSAKYATCLYRMLNQALVFWTHRPGWIPIPAGGHLQLNTLLPDNVLYMWSIRNAVWNDTTDTCIII